MQGAPLARRPNVSVGPFHRQTLRPGRRAPLLLRLGYVGTKAQRGRAVHTEADSGDVCEEQDELIEEAEDAESAGEDDAGGEY